MTDFLDVFVLQTADSFVASPRLRLVIQPTVWVTFAILDGLADAQRHQRPCLSAVLSDPVRRRERLTQGWSSMGRVVIFAFAADVLYQVAALRSLDALEAVLVAVALGLLPYVFAREIAGRLARAVRIWRGRTRRMAFRSSRLGT
jgi:hypothetical protein